MSSERERTVDSLAPASAPPPLPPSQADLLGETRKLLNSLNQENAELKSLNHQLGNQLRAAQVSQQDAERDKTSMEKDLKQLNFNMMQKLQVKASQVRDLQKKIEDMERERGEAHREVGRTQLAQSDLASSNAALQEHNHVLEGKVSHLEEELEKVRHEAGRYSDDLNRILSESRDKQLNTTKEAEATMARLKSEAAEMKDQAAKKAQEAALLKQELSRVKMRYEQENEALGADARRVAQLESDVQYAHDQMHTISTLVFQQLSEMQGKVRAAAETADENDAELHSVLLRYDEQRSYLRSFFSCDAAATEAVAAALREKERRIADCEREMESLRQQRLTADESCQIAQKRAADLELQCRAAANEVTRLKNDNSEGLKTTASLNARLAKIVEEVKSSERTIDQLQQQIKDLQSSNTVAASQIHSIELERSKERSESTAIIEELKRHLNIAKEALKQGELRELAARQQYEEELSDLKERLGSQKRSLAEALIKLDSGPVQPRSSAQSKACLNALSMHTSQALEYGPRHGLNVSAAAPSDGEGTRVLTSRPLFDVVEQPLIGTAAARTPSAPPIRSPRKANEVAQTSAERINLAGGPGSSQGHRYNPTILEKHILSALHQGSPSSHPQ